MIARVEDGEEITLSRNGKAVARIVPLSWKTIVRTPGALRGEIVIHDDFDDFTAQDERDWYGE